MNSDTYSYTNAFIKAFANADMSFRFLDLFPFMIVVFGLDGTVAYINHAGYEELKITDPGQVIGKYSILEDTVIMDTLGQRANIEKAFRGEKMTGHNLIFPSAHFTRTHEPFNKTLIQTVSCFPLWEGQQIAYVAMVLVTTQAYEGRMEIIKAIEYMNKHWKDDFDRDKLAKIANLSPFHFTRLFKQYQGITPKEYYKQIKIKKLCEMLLDPNLSIKQAFFACGVDVKGRYAHYFKEVVDMTPSQYRAMYITPGSKQSGASSK